MQKKPEIEISGFFSSYNGAYPFKNSSKASLLIR